METEFSDRPRYEPSGRVDPLAVLARHLEQKMAELLSNPRLEVALTTIKSRPAPPRTAKAP